MWYKIIYNFFFYLQMIQFTYKFCIKSNLSRAFDKCNLNGISFRNIQQTPSHILFTNIVVCTCVIYKWKLKQNKISFISLIYDADFDLI